MNEDIYIEKIIPQDQIGRAYIYRPVPYRESPHYINLRIILKSTFRDGEEGRSVQVPPGFNLHNIKEFQDFCLAQLKKSSSMYPHVRTAVIVPAFLWREFHPDFKFKKPWEKKWELIETLDQLPEGVSVI